MHRYTRRGLEKLAGVRGLTIHGVFTGEKVNRLPG